MRPGAQHDRAIQESPFNLSLPVNRRESRGGLYELQRKRESARVEVCEWKGPRGPAHLPTAGPDSTVRGTEPKGWASQALAAASLLFWRHTQTVTQESAWRNKQQSRKPAGPSADNPIKKETPFREGIQRWQWESLLIWHNARLSHSCQHSYCAN